MPHSKVQSILPFCPQTFLWVQIKHFCPETLPINWTSLPSIKDINAITWTGGDTPCFSSLMDWWKRREADLLHSTNISLTSFFHKKEGFMMDDWYLCIRHYCISSVWWIAFCSGCIITKEENLFHFSSMSSNCSYASKWTDITWNRTLHSIVRHKGLSVVSLCCVIKPRHLEIFTLFVRVCVIFQPPVIH